MTDRVSLAELQSVVSKAVADVVHKNQKSIAHGPIICGFVAPDALIAADAQKIAAEVSKSVPGSRPTVMGLGEHVEEVTKRPIFCPTSRSSSG